MSSISSLTGAGLNFTGLASGVDTDKIVQGLLSIQQARVTSLQARVDLNTGLQATFKNLQVQVLDLQTQTWRVARTANGAFDARTADVSDPDLVKAAAGSSAAPGTYTFQVKALAQAHQVASAGVADASAALKTGTLELKVGSGATTTINVDASNNTLQGLAAAINAAGGDVAASVINDGSATPYRLLLTSKKSGAANNIQVTNNLTGGAGLSLNLDPATQTIQQGADAQVVLGSGAGALTITSASNKVTTLISGVTLDLQAADPTKTVTLTVGNDTDGAKDAIKNLVDSFNKVIDYIDERDNYDPQTNNAGPLLGNSAAADLQNQLTRALGSVVPGVTQQANRLSAIGITFDDKGHLQVDDAKLDQALTGQLPGVSFADVRRMFALSGASTNSNVSFVLATSKTKAASPVDVNITRAAEQASLTAANAPAGSVVIGPANKDVTLSVNGSTATLQLTEGTYDAAGLAAELQSQINASTKLGGAQVNVAVDSGKLKITTASYGSAAKVTLTGGSALADLGFTAGQTASGLDVAGYFKVNGVTEAATGTGRILSGMSGNKLTDGLQVNVTLTAAQLNADPNAPEAQVSLTRGLGSVLDTTINKFVDVTTGRFKTIDDGYQRSIDDAKKEIDRQNKLIDQKRESLVRQFAAMESTISQLQAVGNSLGAQLGSLSSSRSR